MMRDIRACVLMKDVVGVRRDNNAKHTRERERAKMHANTHRTQAAREIWVRSRYAQARAHGIRMRTTDLHIILKKKTTIRCAHRIYVYMSQNLGWLGPTSINEQQTDRERPKNGFARSDEHDTILASIEQKSIETNQTVRPSDAHTP